jgi:hypothetical protein
LAPDSFAALRQEIVNFWRTQQPATNDGQRESGWYRGKAALAPANVQPGEGFLIWASISLTLTHREQSKGGISR